MFVKLITISAFVFAPLAGSGRCAEAPAHQVVDSIVIKGNNRTKDFVILRELYFEPGDTLSEEMLKEGADRLLNLGIFADVTYHIVPTEDPSLVTVELEVFERARWYLVPLFHWDRDKGKDRPLRGISFGPAVRNINLRGEAHTLRGETKIGARPTVEAAWATPWVGRSPTSLDTRIYWERRETQGGSQEETLARAEVATSRRITKYHRIGFGASLEELRKRPLRTPSDGETRTTVATPSVRLGYDSRDLYVLPAAGSLVRASVGQALDWRTGRYNFTVYSLDLRHFRTAWSGHTVAGGLLLTARRGTVPPHRRASVGGGSSVRGWPEGYSGGIHSFIGVLEYRTPVLAERRFELPRKQYLDFSVASHLFIDAGMAWDDSPFERHVLVGFGLGLRLLLPYSDVLRIDYAWGENQRGRFQIARSIRP